MSGLGEWDDVALVDDRRDEPVSAPSLTSKDAAILDGRQVAPILTKAVQETPTLYYGSVDEFVREFVCPTFRRNVGEQGRAEYRWSARWWESAEAIIRLEAMWRAWEHLRLDPATGISVWLRDHADHHLGVLMSPTGPWALSRDTARPDEPLPYEAPPEALFPPASGH